MIAIYLSIIDSEQDKNKFEILYTTYRKLMFYVANRILKDQYLAEDAVHQAFI
jgi:RNA polymerase sigma-70 factor (ECF subfamily)